jgi:osmoprotectant transport system substrate-binding protein
LNVTPTVRLLSVVAVISIVLGLIACGAGKRVTVSSTSDITSTTTTTTLPGKGRPSITVGDKNFTEQFVLGELYRQALTAKGFDVVLNRNIGPTEVTIQALQSGRLDMYPEYLGTWNSAVAGYRRRFRSPRAALRSARAYGEAHGMYLLKPTPFSDVGAIAVTVAYARENRLRSIGDLAKLAPALVIGAPPQFQTDPMGLPALQRAYGVVPLTFKPLDVGDQYRALDNGTVQAAEVSTTDGQLENGQYVLLRDPKAVFGWGNIVPVTTLKVLAAEGPVFTRTINAVSSLLTTSAIRRLNAEVDVAHEDPASVARRFLQDNGLIVPQPSG